MPQADNNHNKKQNIPPHYLGKKFQLESNFSPMGDQPQAIKTLVNGVNAGEKFQTLLGVTGSGKTFTLANVIKQTKPPIGEKLDSS
jgi:excinuclease UvrABC helicase subunit UvrB